MANNPDYTEAQNAIITDRLRDILTERFRQDILRKQGRFMYTCADIIMAPNGLSQEGFSDLAKFAILTEEIGEVGRELNNMYSGALDGPYDTVQQDRLYKELVQVAAVVLAWIESIPLDTDSTIADGKDS